MKIGIVGATGLVGRTILQVMEERKLFPDRLRLFASFRSAGTAISFNKREYITETLQENNMQEHFDFLLFSAGKEVSLHYAAIAERSGNNVIDNSSAYRKDRPLIVPEINSELLKGYRGIVANPNCSTIQLVLALFPIGKLYGLKRLVVSTYQSVSGAGNSAIEKLLGERKANVNSSLVEDKFLDLNLAAAIGPINEAGHSQEELKMQYETAKILGLDKLEVAVTAIRVPVLFGHAESVFAEFDCQVELEKIVKAWEQESFIGYSKNIITPRQAEGSDLSYVCRLRGGCTADSILFWNVADNIRVGAATNAVNIMQSLINYQMQ